MKPYRSRWQCRRARCPRHRCHQKPLVGPCEAAIRKWFYNPKTKVRTPFRLHIYANEGQSRFFPWKFVKPFLTEPYPHLMSNRNASSFSGEGARGVCRSTLANHAYKLVATLRVHRSLHQALVVQPFHAISSTTSQGYVSFSISPCSFSHEETYCIVCES